MADSKQTPSARKWRDNLGDRADSFRHRLAHIDALPQMTLLGLISGALAAGLIVLFRFAIDIPLAGILGDGDFESLPPLARLLLPLAGAIAIGAMLQALPAALRQVSVPHVLSRLHSFQGRLPAANIAVQFIGGSLAQISGQSMGREGPAIHMGAGIASQLGQQLKLPNNSLRILVGCGVAAAIAAAFDTPIAGVIFAMEVVLMEYTISGFIPVIMASVVGAGIAKAVFGQTLYFAGIDSQLGSLWELPYIALGGVAVALAAGAFIKIHLWVLDLKRLPILLKATLAGLLTGLLATQWPQIMGNGYDTIAASGSGQLGLVLLLGLVAAKVVATSVSSGAGLTGGVIGPILVIGACLGGALGQLGAHYSPIGSASVQLYVLLGATAMMAAVLNAPLAALLAVLELSHSPDIVLPAMLMIVSACVITRFWFCDNGIFLAHLRQIGEDIDHTPSQQVLSRAGVRSVMSNRFARCDSVLSRAGAEQMLQHKPQWLLLEREQALVMSAADLSRHLQEHPGEAETELDLLKIPAQRLETATIDQSSNLFEAKQQFDRGEAGALVVVRQNRRQGVTIGIVTRDHISSFYG